MDDVMQQYRRDLVTREWSQNDTFDKMVVTLAGGALVTSFAFLSDIVGDSEPVFSWVLAIGWSLLVLSLSANLATHWLGAMSHRHAMTQLDADVLDDVAPGGTVGAIADVLHASSGVLLIAGLSFLAAFAFINL